MNDDTYYFTDDDTSLNTETYIMNTLNPLIKIINKAIKYIYKK